MDVTIGKLLKKLRLQKGLTQSELGEMINVSDKAISRWESDLGLPEVSNLIALAKIFDTTVDRLLAGDGAESETLGTRIKSLRVNKGMTQAQLGAILGVYETAVYSWESDSVKPGLSGIMAIAKALGVTVDELLAGIDLDKSVKPPERAAAWNPYGAPYVGTPYAAVKPVALTEVKPAESVAVAAPVEDIKTSSFNIFNLLFLFVMTVGMYAFTALPQDNVICTVLIGLITAVAAAFFVLQFLDGIGVKMGIFNDKKKKHIISLSFKSSLLILFIVLFLVGFHSNYMRMEQVYYSYGIGYVPYIADAVFAFAALFGLLSTFIVWDVFGIIPFASKSEFSRESEARLIKRRDIINTCVIGAVSLFIIIMTLFVQFPAAIGHEANFLAAFAEYVSRHTVACGVLLLCLVFLSDNLLRLFKKKALLSLPIAAISLITVITIMAILFGNGELRFSLYSSFDTGIVYIVLFTFCVLPFLFDLIAGLIDKPSAKRSLCRLSAALYAIFAIIGLIQSFDAFLVNIYFECNAWAAAAFFRVIILIAILLYAFLRFDFNFIKGQGERK